MFSVHSGLYVLPNFLRLSLGNAGVHCMHKHLPIFGLSVGGKAFSEELKTVYRHDTTSFCKILGNMLEADAATWILWLKDWRHRSFEWEISSAWPFGTLRKGIKDL